MAHHFFLLFFLLQFLEKKAVLGETPEKTLILASRKKTEFWRQNRPGGDSGSLLLHIFVIKQSQDQTKENQV